ncbi:MAG TPA: hypothetical protein VF147_00340 [Vicinamibacterales bacterium]
MPSMVRGFQTFVLAVLVALCPVARLACDLACVPAPVQAATPSHCASHPAAPDPTPSAPQDRCGHDHQPVRFIGAADQPTPSLDMMAGLLPGSHAVPITAELARRAKAVARGGPSHAPRSLVLRI